MSKINISNVHFLKSITTNREKPAPALPEIAVIGRSNVGKSSLINTLFIQKKLAKISSQPGKTRLINYFNVDDKCYFVDLPGYGFAKGRKKKSDNWKRMIETYLVDNRLLVMVLLLIDSRRGIMAIDELMLDWLDHYQIKYTIVLTKIDKISNNELIKVSKDVKEMSGNVEIIKHSSKSKKGRNELINLLNYEINMG
jgi:GTP-binding protein